MPRKPQPGGDSGSWGDILNEYLDVSHSLDGTLKANSVAGSQVQDGSITEAKLSGAVQTKLNSGGGAVADGSITTAKLADGAVTDAKVTDVAQSKVTGLSTALSAKYTFPGGGIPEADLSSAVQTKLNAAGVTNINDLSDVNTSGVVDGQALVWQGSQWGAATISGGGGSTDHGALTGLADDDHPQYLNNTRGDARYYTQTQVDTSLGGKANTTHTHAAADITSGTIASARLGSGTADNTTFLRGDGVWAVPAGSSGNTYTAVNRISAYTANANDFVVCNASAGGFTVTLPAPTNGTMVRVKKIDNTANAVIVDAPGSGLIDNTPSASINVQWQSNDFLSDGTQWYFV